MTTTFNTGDLVEVIGNPALYGRIVQIQESVCMVDMSTAIPGQVEPITCAYYRIQKKE